MTATRGTAVRPAGPAHSHRVLVIAVLGLLAGLLTALGPTPSSGAVAVAAPSQKAERPGSRPQSRIVGGPRNGAVLQVRSTVFEVASGARDLRYFECQRDGGAWKRCATRTQRLVVAGGSYGTHVLRVRAVDADGNRDRTPAVRRFTTRYFVAVDAGGDRTCGIRATGTIRCWGKPFPGGAKPPAGRYQLVDVGPGDHACAVKRASHGIVCWGANGAGQATVPAGAWGGESGEVFVGRDHTCSPTRCWGDNAQGELAVPPHTRVGGVGRDFSCGYVADTPGQRSARCWGDPSTGVTQVPSEVDSFLATGENRACGLESDEFSSSVVCWGAPAPRPDFSAEAFDYGLELGLRHACSIGTEVRCSGSNTFGQARIPDPPASVRRIPYLQGLPEYAGVSDYDDVTTGRNHSCAVRLDGATLCRGDNRAGQSAVPSA